CRISTTGCWHRVTPLALSWGGHKVPSTSYHYALGVRPSVLLELSCLLAGCENGPPVSSFLRLNRKSPGVQQNPNCPGNGKNVAGFRTTTPQLMRTAVS